MSLFERSWVGKLLAKAKDSISSKNDRQPTPANGDLRGLVNRPELASGSLLFTLTHEQGVNSSVYFTMGCFLLDDSGKLNDAYHDFASYTLTRARGGVYMTGMEGVAERHIGVDTDIVPERYSKLLFVMSMRSAESHQLKKLHKLTLTVNKRGKNERRQKTLLEVNFNPKMLDGETSIVLGCLDLKTLSFGAAGIACNEGFERLSEYLLTSNELNVVEGIAPDDDLELTECIHSSNELMNALGSSYPNCLDVDINVPMTADEQIHHLVWGTAALVEQILAIHYTPVLAQERGIEILTRCRAAWAPPALFVSHEMLIRRLMEDGVDWYASCKNGKVDSPLSMNDKIANLLENASSNTPWERAVLSALSDEVMIEYLSGVSQKKADTVYRLAPRECMLNFVSEKMRVAQLEADMGL